MHRFLLLLLLVFLVAAGWYSLYHFELAGLDEVSVRRRTDVAADSAPTPSRPDAGINAIRIASFNMQALSVSKLREPGMAEVLVDVLRRFDVVALQQIRSVNPPLMPILIDQMNTDGHRYEFIVSEPQSTTTSGEQFAYVFDNETIEADVRGAYTVNDPHDLLYRPPLVCAFRVRGPPKNEAFTFVLINVHAGPDEMFEKRNVLADAYRAIRRHSGGEDDILMLGDFSEGGQQSEAWDSLPGGRFVLSGVATDVARTTPYDNILLHERSTTEFTGRAGVFDIMQEFDFTPDEALRISGRLPVWAEFTAYERGLTRHAEARQQPAESAPIRR